jgi:hypothetical protein
MRVGKARLASSNANSGCQEAGGTILTIPVLRLGSNGDEESSRIDGTIQKSQTQSFQIKIKLKIKILKNIAIACAMDCVMSCRHVSVSSFSASKAKTIKPSRLSPLANLADALNQLQRILKLFLGRVKCWGLRNVINPLIQLAFTHFTPLRRRTLPWAGGVAAGDVCVCVGCRSHDFGFEGADAR